MGDSPRDASDGPRPESGQADLWHAGTDGLFVGVEAICDTATRLTGADGAAVAVLTRTRAVRELVYATDALAQQIDELQFVLGEGPCLDAYDHDRAQLCAQLDDEMFEARWPAFTAELTDLGVAAVFAYPVPGRNHPFGVLELYRRTAGELDRLEQHSAQVCAVALRDTLESNWRTHVSQNVSEEAAIESVVLSGAVVPPPDSFTRSQVYVAAGMVAVQLTISTQDGLDRLRAYSFAHKRSIMAVAADVVARRLSFRGLDEPEGGDR
ncbi:GAF and ANTAR domain-containing protein [Mycobacterium sp. 21AC1]|uniref:GAF and ANTAR domain-containing protein n=1 Tax=[Mycobacterium] appelbergii TaxID=2939269 RepID=UPI0029394B77|nr:GAF and ANTAR domain-containing protein [Mycobacterium sp. 21AC1]MDV3123565.1 GAF and ANTAR domain-containing protein [Mycobacterium sp. 21AC1]